jgi:uncharacterized membrane protein YedE/YeeE
MGVLAAAFLSGLLFAIGLVLGGMTQPSKVVGFLDLTGDWDPSLALVMGGALGTHALGRRLVLRRPRPLLDSRFHLPTRSEIDASLLGGAAIFGIGWGLGGFCPGPAMVALGAGARASLVFVPAMIAGMLLHDRWFAELAATTAANTAPPGAGSGERSPDELRRRDGSASV